MLPMQKQMKTAMALANAFPLEQLSGSATKKATKRGSPLHQTGAVDQRSLSTLVVCRVNKDNQEIQHDSKMSLLFKPIKTARRETNYKAVVDLDARTPLPVAG